jgi:hypothetical protein
MSSVHSKLAQALVPLLTVSLLAMGCNDSTAPSSGDTAASQPAAQPPAAPSEASAGSGQVPTHAASEAPKVNRGNPLDTATSGLKPAFLTRSNASYNPNWTTGMPTVRVPLGAVQCVANLLGTAGIDVSATGGKSIVFNQHVVGETWFYRWNGTAWVAKPVIRTDLALHGGMLAAPFGTVPGTSLGMVYSGYYSAVTKLTWFIQLNDGRWVQTATATYSFDRASDYAVALGATAGPGYCKVP